MLSGVELEIRGVLVIVYDARSQGRFESVLDTVPHSIIRRRSILVRIAVDPSESSCTRNVLTR